MRYRMEPCGNGGPAPAQYYVVDSTLSGHVTHICTAKHDDAVRIVTALNESEARLESLNKRSVRRRTA